MSSSLSLSLCHVCTVHKLVGEIEPRIQGNKRLQPIAICAVKRKIILKIFFSLILQNHQGFIWKYCNGIDMNSKVNIIRNSFQKNNFIWHTEYIKL